MHHTQYEGKLWPGTAGKRVHATSPEHDALLDDPLKAANPASMPMHPPIAGQSYFHSEIMEHSLDFFEQFSFDNDNASFCLVWQSIHSQVLTPTETGTTA